MMAFPRKEKAGITKVFGQDVLLAKLSWIQYQENILIHFKGDFFVYNLNTLKFDDGYVNQVKYQTPDKLNKALVGQYNENVILLYTDSKIVSYDTFQHKFLPDKQSQFKAAGKYGVALDRDAKHLLVQENDQIEIIDVTSGKVNKVLLKDSLNNCYFLTTGENVVITDRNGNVHVVSSPEVG